MRFFDIFKRSELDCQQTREASSDYLDGDIGGRERARIARHLKGCAPCAAFMNTLRATIELLRASQVPNPPDGFKQRIRDSLAN